MLFRGTFVLVGVSEKIVRLSLWLVCFRQFNPIGPLFLYFCSTFDRLNFWCLRSRRAWGRFSYYTNNFLCFQKYRGHQSVSPLDFFRQNKTFFRKGLISIRGYTFGFFEFLVSKYRLLSLNGLFWVFWQNAKIFYQILFLKQKQVFQIFSIVVRSLNIPEPQI